MRGVFLTTSLPTANCDSPKVVCAELVQSDAILQVSHMFRKVNRALEVLCFGSIKTPNLQSLAIEVYA